MPTIAANGIELFYEDHGDPADPAVLLIMGLGTQLIGWPDDFVAALVGAGYRVVRYDNRDIGLSTHLDGAYAAHPLRALIAVGLGLRFRLAYTLRDMATDAVAMLDALGISQAHIVGASMGGMIAQRVAADWPSRVLTLTSIMSSSGARGLPGPSPALRRQLMAKRPADPTRDEAISAGEAVLAAISYPDPARPPGAFRELAARAFDRRHDPAGTQRQLLAIVGDRDRAALIGAIRAPTLVIHGAADPLIPLPNGEDTARRIPGARLEVIDAMAHDLPPSALPRLRDLIVDHFRA